MRAPFLELEKVVVDRHRVRILDLPKLRIESGENVVLLGPNGCGKSTLLKLMMRWIYPSAGVESQGTFRIFGRSEWNVWELRKHMGFVSMELDHHFALGRSGRLTPTQAILTGFESSELELEESEITPEMREQAESWNRFFGLESCHSKHLSWLSTGERRRVMIARALVCGARTLLLDEPTSGLDLAAREQLLKLLEELMAQGIQILLVTHHVEDVLPGFRRCLLMKKGRLCLDSSVDSALTSANLTDLFELPLTVEMRQSRYSIALGQ
jgi:iron complex transport system ATP-binding protein